LIVAVPPRQGKLIAHETPVLTTSGWKTHGDLRAGDWVYNPKGYPVRVIALSPDDRADYAVKISNGDEIWCHGAHEWTVADNKGKNLATIETKDLESFPYLLPAVYHPSGGFKQNSIISVANYPDHSRALSRPQPDANP
jgi:hypothetical protein